ncbi:MAG: M48 family metalloprotease [Comamonas sp.]|nr:M48 family metalloprotease [Comamonas sp.]
MAQNTFSPAQPHTTPHPRPRLQLARRLMLSLACVLALGSTAQAQVQLPHLGDGADWGMSQERQVGDSIIPHLYRDPDYIDDAPLHAYVMGLWHPLVQAALARGDMSEELHERFAWQLLLGKDRSINAFALPGGYLGVHLGLIGAVTSSDELATVLAHELSHVTQRHIARMMGEEKKNMPLLLAGMVLGALAASKSPDAAQALILGGHAAAAQNQLSFSRDMEREADRVGFNLLAPAGFNPQGAASMFDKLQQASRLNDNGSWPYLRSHPLTSERIADMQSRLPPDAPAQPLTGSYEHALMAARARVLSQPGIDRLRQWAEQAQGSQGSDWAQRPPKEQAAILYAAALAQQQLRQPQAADKNAQRLEELLQRQQAEAAALRQSAWLRAELALANEQPQAALQALRQAPTLPKTAANPEAQRPALLLQARALLALQRPQEAAEPLQTWVSLHPQDAQAWQVLAQAWQAAGQPLRSLRAQAEAQVAIYDYSAALDRFKAAQTLAQRSGAAADHIEASIINTRLREMQSKLKEQASQK